MAKQRDYQVRVVKTEPQHVWIEVRASSSKEAKKKALAKAPEYDLLEWSGHGRRRMGKVLGVPTMKLVPKRRQPEHCIDSGRN